MFDFTKTATMVTLVYWARPSSLAGWNLLRFFCLPCFNLIFISTATVIFADPKDVTVEANEWAQFNCTVRCGYIASWYMAGYPKAIKRNNIVPGLLIKRQRASGRTESDEWTHVFEVLATEAFNKSTFYCAAHEICPQENSCSCGMDGRCYSMQARPPYRWEPLECVCVRFSTFSLPNFVILASSNSFVITYIICTSHNDTMQWEWHLLLLLRHKQLGYQK